MSTNIIKKNTKNIKNDVFTKKSDKNKIKALDKLQKVVYTKIR